MVIAQFELLSHPLTIAGVCSATGLLGWYGAQIYTLSRDSSTWKRSIENIEKLLDHVIKKQEGCDETIGKIQHDLTKLETEHNMVKRAGNLLHGHSSLKTEP